MKRENSLIVNAASGSMDRNFVVFITGLFRLDQPDEAIDLWFLGEDCAHWLHNRLLALDDVTPGRAPLEEDWGGWTFGVRAHRVWFWINIWRFFLEPRSWTVGVEPRPGLLRIFSRSRTRVAKGKLCDQLDSVLASASEIGSRKWFEDSPWA